MHRFIKIKIIRDFEQLGELGLGCADPLLEIHHAAACFRPAADFYETAQGLVLRLELAGVAAEDVSLSLTSHELVVQGRRRPRLPDGIKRFMHLEIGFGTFYRRFTLPCVVDPEGVEARYQDGILTVSLPRRSPQTRRIPVKSSPSSPE
jgi:HSP20 family protein